MLRMQRKQRSIVTWPYMHSLSTHDLCVCVSDGIERDAKLRIFSRYGSRYARSVVPARQLAGSGEQSPVCGGDLRGPIRARLRDCAPLVARALEPTPGRGLAVAVVLIALAVEAGEFSYWKAREESLVPGSMA